MTSSTECSQTRILLGVYVLGAIEPAERSIVDAHLSVCQRCRDELASLAGLPAMLGRITEDQIEQIGPPGEELLDSILSKAAAETRGQRRKNRLWLVASAAALVAATGVGTRAVTDLTGGDGGTVAKPPATSASPWSSTGTGPTTTVSGADPTTGIQGWISAQPNLWGTALKLTLAGAPSGAHCKLVVTGKDGSTDTAGSWTVAYVGTATYEGSSMIQKKDIRSFEVRTMDGRKLLSLRM
jgi:hypothetical protein